MRVCSKVALMGVFFTACANPVEGTGSSTKSTGDERDCSSPNETWFISQSEVDAAEPGDGLCYVFGLRLDFSYRDLSGVDFTRSDLTSSSFVGATLTGATFNGATLAGADFSGATGAYLETAASLCETTMPDGSLASEGCITPEPPEEEPVPASCASSDGGDVPPGTHDGEVVCTIEGLWLPNTSTCLTVDSLPSQLDAGNCACYRDGAYYPPGMLIECVGDDLSTCLECGGDGEWSARE